MSEDCYCWMNFWIQVPLTYMHIAHVIAHILFSSFFCEKKDSKMKSQFNCLDWKRIEMNSLWKYFIKWVRILQMQICSTGKAIILLQKTSEVYESFRPHFFFCFQAWSSLWKRVTWRFSKNSSFMFHRWTIEGLKRHEGE